MGLQLGPENTVTKYAMSVNAGRLNQDFIVYLSQGEFRRNSTTVSKVKLFLCSIR
jgi:hypothetical protein